MRTTCAPALRGHPRLLGERDMFGSATATTPGIPPPSDREEVVLAVVRLLLEYGADAPARRRPGMTPLDVLAAP
jgi:hypothetical protein